MPETCKLPEFNIDDARRIARDLYGIVGDLEKLEGERDLNYRISTDSGRFVFKIANRDEDYELLECQLRAMQRLAADKVMPHLASAVESRNGKPIEGVVAPDGEAHFCRMLTYVEGRPLSGIEAPSSALLNDLGALLARFDKSLLNFHRQVLNRPFIWKMDDAPSTLKQFKPLLASRDERALVDYFESQFLTRLAELQEDLRRGAIHNDANDNNLLVNDHGGNLIIGAIIDFGDMVESWLAVEPAVAAAYMMMGKQRPLNIAAEIIRGYHSILPLREREIDMLFDFICMRLCLSVCICAYQKSVEPGNEYLSISEKPAWELLGKLRLVAPDEARAQFRAACGLEATSG